MKVTNVDKNILGKVVEIQPIETPSPESGNPRCIVLIMWMGTRGPLKYLSNSIWYNSNRDILEIHELDARREFMTSKHGHLGRSGW